MVTGQLTVPCNSLSNLYSHVQLCSSPSMLVANMVVFLQYTVIAMQHIIVSSVKSVLLLQGWRVDKSVFHVTQIFAINYCELL